MTESVPPCFGVAVGLGRRSTVGVGSARLAAVLGLVFIAVNVVALRGGVLVHGDSDRYLGAAERLLGGDGLDGYQATFAGYAGLVALSQLVGAGVWGVVIAQLIAAALAALALYDLGRRLGGPAAGLVASALVVANIDIARWNAHVLTESLYTSALTMAVWTVYRAAQHRGGWYPAAALLVLFAASIRPHGWVLVPLTGAYWVATAPWSRATRWMAAAGLLAVVTAAAALAPAHAEGLRQNLRAATGQDTGEAGANWGLMMRRGLVVWNYEDWDVAMPEAGDRSMPRYIVDHPMAVTRLVAARIGAELLHARPYYSLRHNAFVAIYLVPMYAFALVGLVRRWHEPAVWMVGAVVGGHLLFIGFTWADWDGRFLTYVLPLVGLLAALGVSSRWSERRSSYRPSATLA